MILFLLWSFTYLMLSPSDSLPCDREYYSIAAFRDHIYGASFTGNTVYALTEETSNAHITFTDDPLYRIVDFKITPFSLYVNNGQGIVRILKSTATSISMIASMDICCFDVTPEEEIIYADRKERAVHYLDYTGTSMQQLEDILAYDLCIETRHVYILTRGALLRLDEHGNILERTEIDTGYNSMYVYNGTVFLFTRGQRNLCVLKQDEQSHYTLAHKIQDISSLRKNIYILNGTGTCLYIYHHSDF